MPAGVKTQFKPGGQHPRYKTGAYAKVIPKRLYDAYKQALKDPDLLVQREEIALKRARLAEILGTIDTGESDKTWARLLDAKYRFQLHSQIGTKPDKDKMRIALDEIMALIDEGNEARLRWDDAHREVMALDKLKGSERRRISELKAYVTADQAIGMLATISYHLKEAVEQNITDKKSGDKVIRAVAKQVKRLLTAGELLAKKEDED